MKEKQLNVWIDGHLKDTLAKQAEYEELSVKEFTERIITKAVTQYQGEVLEKQALPIIRDLVQSELRKALAQMLMELREDVHAEIIQQMKYLTQRSDEHHSERIAALSVRTVRDSSINRHLLYSLLAKSQGIAFARDAYEHAKEKAARELEEHTVGKDSEEDE